MCHMCYYKNLLVMPNFLGPGGSPVGETEFHRKVDTLLQRDLIRSCMYCIELC